MNDLVYRLREDPSGTDQQIMRRMGHECFEAADEIERLRAGLRMAMTAVLLKGWEELANQIDVVLSPKHDGGNDA